MAEVGQDEVDVKDELVSIRGDLIHVKKGLNTVGQNLTSVIRNLPSPTETGEEQVAKFTVLSWNIWSKEDSDQDSCDLLVSRVVDYVNPDVLLLQSSYTSTIDCITHHCKPKSYKDCDEETENVKILYDPCVFELGESIDLSAVVAKVFPEETNKDQEIFKEDSSHFIAFQLEHKNTEKKIVFMSFKNNDNYSEEKCTKRRAEGLCKIVSRTAVKKKMLVVAGTDLLCEDFPLGLARIPTYNVPRRSEGYQVTTHFVSAWPGDITVEDHISVLDPDDISLTLLSRVFKGSVDDYKSSLWEDPLVYTLSVSNVQV